MWSVTLVALGLLGAIAIRLLGAVTIGFGGLLRFVAAVMRFFVLFVLRMAERPRVFRPPDFDLDFLGLANLALNSCRLGGGFDGSFGGKFQNGFCWRRFAGNNGRRQFDGRNFHRLVENRRFCRGSSVRRL